MSNGVLKPLLGWIPNWLGFGLIILAGLLALFYGFVITPSAGLVAFGVAAVTSALLAWTAGGTSTPRVNPGDKSFGGTVANIDGWVWLVIFGLFVAALLIALLAS